MLYTFKKTPVLPTILFIYCFSALSLFALSPFSPLVSSIFIPMMQSDTRLQSSLLYWPDVSTCFPWLNPSLRMVLRVRLRGQFWVTRCYKSARLSTCIVHIVHYVMLKLCPNSRSALKILNLLIKNIICLHCPELFQHICVVICLRCSVLVWKLGQFSD